MTIFLSSTADDINLGANLTADGNVDLDSTNGNVLQIAGDVLAGITYLDAAASSKVIDLDGTIDRAAIGGDVLIGKPSPQVMSISMGRSMQMEVWSLMVRALQLQQTLIQMQTPTLRKMLIWVQVPSLKLVERLMQICFAKIVSSGSTVSIVDLDSAGAYASHGNY